MAYHATPTLSYAGEPPPYPHIVANSIPAAFEAVKSGRSVHVFDRDTAEKVLLSLGMDSDTARFRLHFAETGEILHSVDPQPVR